MASAGDAIAETEAATKKIKRISDYLGDSDGDEPPPPSPGTPPQLRLPRFTCARFRFVRLRRKGRNSGRKEVAAEKSETVSVESSGCRQAGSSSSSSASVEASMGLSMLLLLGKTCVQLNRMSEVRAQMETLLKEIRDEASKVKSVDHVVVTPRTCNLQSSSAASSSCTSDTNTNCLEIARGENERKRSEDQDRTGVDVLEAEFETEPPQRELLECNCSITEQETPESSSDGEFIELERGRLGGGSFRRGVGDDESEEESTTGERDGGVSALELERRLHELLHRRNRERIEELEAALRRAERKLMEKEMEARMWQDTATLALGQQPARDGQ